MSKKFVEYCLNGKKREKGTSNPPPLKQSCSPTPQLTAKSFSNIKISIKAGRGGIGGKCHELFFLLQIFPYLPRSLDSNRIKHKEEGGGSPADHPPQGRILTSFCPFLLHGADNERRIELIYSFFMLQGAGD